MKVEIWSDVVCPFCYIGKRKFEGALAQFAHRDDVEITWHSFQLAPDAPRESTERVDDILAAKFGGDRARAKAMHEHVTREAAAVGLRYDFDRAQQTNTFDAHRFSHLAAAHGLQDAAEEKLFAAYFTEGRHIGRPETLREIATEIGLDPEAVTAMLAGDDYAAEVNADIAEAREIGITGVPFFVIDRQYGVSGAQPTETFLQVLRQVWAESHPLTMLGGQPAANAADEDCADGVCAAPAPAQRQA
ncbi:MAG TPA: DsbA family oxidoreductase [Thermomicrobiales bacterium]|jgi:predicted DsbA family dithiol-disulfide isomerase